MYVGFSIRRHRNLILICKRMSSFMLTIFCFNGQLVDLAMILIEIAETALHMIGSSNIWFINHPASQQAMSKAISSVSMVHQKSLFAYKFQDIATPPNTALPVSLDLKMLYKLIEKIKFIELIFFFFLFASFLTFLLGKKEMMLTKIC